MRKKLFSLLAAAVLGKFMVPAAAAQVPEAGVLGMPSVSAKAWLGYESTNTSAPMGGFWLEFAANQGPIARALGLPAPAAPKRRGTLALNAGCDAVPDGSIFTYACFANSLPSDNSVGFQAAKYESGAGDFCQHAECPMGIVGLPSAYAELTAVPGCDAPASTIDWNGADRPGVQFNVGGDVCVTTIMGSNGHQNLSQCTGVGSSIWLGCALENGLEIRAGFSFYSIVGGQQVFESRR